MKQMLQGIAQWCSDVREGEGKTRVTPAEFQVGAWMKWACLSKIKNMGKQHWFLELTKDEKIPCARYLPDAELTLQHFSED